MSKRDREGDCGCGKGHKRFGRCRISRPLCRKMRRRKGLCGCDGYHYPHREGGGLCAFARRAAHFRNLVLYGPAPEVKTA